MSAHAARDGAASGPAPVAWRRPLRWRAVLAGIGGSLASALGLIAGAGVLKSPLLLLGIPVALAGLVGLMLSPAAAFLLTAFVVPVERLGRFTNDDAMLTISLMRIVGSVALASFLLDALLRGKRLHFGAALWLYVLYLGMALTGVTHSTHMLGTVRHIGAILGNLLFFFLALNLGRDARLAQRAVQVWLISTVLAGVYTIVTWHLGQGATDAELTETSARFSTVMTDTSEWEALDVVARATGPTSHSAVYGMNLILSLPMFLFSFKHARQGWLRLAVAAGIGITLYNVLLTNTRAVMLVAALIMVLGGVRGLYRVSAAGLVSLMVAGAAMLPFVPDAVWNRVLDTSNYSTAKSATLRVRLDYWAAGLQVVNDHWLTGIGVGNQVEVPKRLNFTTAETTTVHNEYIFTAMEVGVFGWLLFFGFVALIYWSAVKAQQLSALRHAQAPPGTLPPPAVPHPDFFVAAQLSMLATLIFGVQVDVFHFPLKGWWLLAALSWAQYAAMVEARTPRSLGSLRPGTSHASPAAPPQPAPPLSRHRP